MRQEPGPARVILPPRPNLGPEPWSPARTESVPVVAAVLTLCFVLLLAAWVIRRRRALRRRPDVAPVRLVSHDEDPPARLVIVAGQARERLVALFGPALRARTTEEIASDPRLREALGEADFAPLIRLLASADRWKFAHRPEDGVGELAIEDVDRWEAWCRAAAVPPPSAKQDPRPTGDDPPVEGGGPTTGVRYRQRQSSTSCSPNRTPRTSV